jgi:hypothetical protein
MSKARDLSNSGTAFTIVSATELEYVDGLTSNAQTQINTKAPISTTVTLTGAQTVTNKLISGPVFLSPEERSTITATAATGTVHFDVVTQGILYYTSNATANWTLNIRGDSGTTLNSLMTTGDIITVVFLNTNGVTAYYPTAFQIDGSSVTPKWQSGFSPASGDVSSINAYSLTIIKTASATFTVLGSQSKFV